MCATQENEFYNPTPDSDSSTPEAEAAEATEAAPGLSAGQLVGGLIVTGFIAATSFNKGRSYGEETMPRGKAAKQVVRGPNKDWPTPRDKAKKRAKAKKEAAKLAKAKAKAKEKLRKKRAKVREKEGLWASLRVK